MSHSSESPAAFNFVLLGKSGSGKSAAGNTILGQNAFSSKRSLGSVTKRVQIKHGKVFGVPVTVYDTPGFFHTELNNDEVRQECETVFSSCESEAGLWTYLLVIRADRFTEEEKKTVQETERLLGQKHLENTWILFTRGDELEKEGQTINEFIRDTESLQELVQKYNNRFHVFNNNNITSDQVEELLVKICNQLIKSASHLQRTKPTTTSSRPDWRNTGAGKRATEKRIIKDDTPTSSIPDRNIVLLGKTGSGKSTTGNTILGERKFKSRFSAKSVTSKSEAHQRRVEDRNVCVIDTPGLCDTSVSPFETAAEIGRSIYLSSPGPHAFLIVLQLGRFTVQEQKIVELIELMFGQEVSKYAMILFTHGDALEDETAEELIKENDKLNDLVQKCGGGYHVFNNKDLKNREQVRELLHKMDRMLERNGGTCYSNEMYEEAARLKQEEEEERRREEEEKQQREEEEKQEEIENVKRQTEVRVRKEVAPNPSKSSNEETFMKKYWKWIVAGLVIGVVIGVVIVVVIGAGGYVIVA